MKPGYYIDDQIRRLPPLILHPFSDAQSPDKLVRSSRASLMLQGLLPSDGHTLEQLGEIVAQGRMCEVRMLYYVGKDVLRWVEQCAEIVEREPELRAAGVEWQSFAALLIDDAPARVKEKLHKWGVQDYRAIFSRGIGLNAVFADLPHRDLLGPEFIQSYHQYADGMFNCWLNSRAFARLRSQEFEFELYASGEYSRMLEQEWEAGI